MMKTKKALLFLSLVPFLTGCGRTFCVIPKEELVEAVKKLDHSVNYEDVSYETEGHVCGLKAENFEIVKTEAYTKAYTLFQYNSTLTDPVKIAEDKENVDKMRKDYIDKYVFRFKDEDKGGSITTLSKFLKVPMRLYQTTNKEDQYHDYFEKKQYITLVNKTVQDEHNGGRVFDEMSSEILDDGLRFYCDGNYKVLTIYSIDVKYGDVLARGRFDLSFTYDKNGYLVEESIKTDEFSKDIEKNIDFKVNYLYE